MLSELFIKNLAIIKEAKIPLTEGLNVFTGETGAGKSVLIGAINGLLGGRMSKDLIRTGESKAQIVGVFTGLSQGILQRLSDIGYPLEEDEPLLISREMTQSTTTCRINGMPTTVAVLRQLGESLVGIHGQHDNQILFNIEQHREILDHYSGGKELLTAYQQAYGQYLKLQQQLEELRHGVRTRNQRIDLLTFQTRELEDAQLKVGEEELLLQRRNTIRNLSKLTKILGGALEKLTGGDGEREGIDSLLSMLQEDLEEGEEYIPTLKEPRELVEAFNDELRGIVGTLHDAYGELEYDPSELEEIESRLDLLYRLKRKYDMDIPELMQYYADSLEELSAITFSTEKKEALEQAFVAAEKEALSKSQQLTTLRQQGGIKLCKELQLQLQDLDMDGVEIVIDFQSKPLTINGGDRIEFLISTNKGEEPKPMAKIASGGELSRIMLGLKTISNAGEGVGTAIFDEVDTGVSGRAAQKIGKKLQQVATDQQILCVTHLSQVASFGDSHLYIYKEEQDGRVSTIIEPLSQSRRIEEIARINSGEHITDLALSTATEMLALHERR